MVMFVGAHRLTASRRRRRFAKQRRLRLAVKRLIDNEFGTLDCSRSGAVQARRKVTLRIAKTLVDLKTGLIRTVVGKYDDQKKTISAILGKGVEEPKEHLSRPHGVCVHTDGSIFVVDTEHHRIIRLRQQ